MDRKTLILGSVIAIALSVVVLFILYKPGGPASDDLGSLTEVKIIDGLSANSVHIHVADKFGFFNEEGIQADVSYTPIGKFAMDALNAGSVDYAGIVEMNVSHTLFTHDDVAILTEYSEPITGIKVLGRKDKGVSSANDLVGKKIGVFFGVNIHVFMTLLLEEHSISEDEVVLVNMSPPDAVAAFISGDIDALITWQPHVFNIQQRVGENVVVLTDEAQKYWPYKLLLATKRSYLEEHEDEAKKILRALIKADEFIRDHPSEVHQTIAEHLKLEPEQVKMFMEEIHYEIRLTPRLIEMMAYEVEWLPKHLALFFEGKNPVTTDFQSLVADELRTVLPSAYMIE